MQLVGTFRWPGSTTAGEGFGTGLMDLLSTLENSLMICRSSMRLGALLVLLAGVCVVGCGQKGPRRYDLSGQVTYQGEPVPMGEISFDPVDPQGVGGGFAPINDGKFDTSVDGRGHLGGEHRVQIVGFSGWVDPNDHDKGAVPMFPPYETTIDLPTNTDNMDFEVPAGEGS